jgi:hypothetical protein
MRRIVLAAAALALSGCGSATLASTRMHAAQIRADAFAAVASRLYAEEDKGPTGRRNAGRIAHDQRLIAALVSGRHAAIRGAALRELFLPVKHVVRIRVVRRGRPVVDVGGAFVAGAESARLPGGLGRVDVSMQDVLGLTKLVHRFTGAQIVVHGHRGHVIASLPVLRRARLPRSGRITVRGRTYAVRTIRRIGWPGEPLRISVLVRA